MSKAPSEKTQLATAKRQIKRLEAELRYAQQYRVRATTAEQAVIEWKNRFDKLLEFRRLNETENV